MSFDLERLYGLLPALYRVRDAEQGQPLKALLSVIADQVAVLEEDLAQLYDDQFIETCAGWAVPYIGDLIGYRTLYGVTGAAGSPRAEVANTIGYRRRKGTAAVLEDLARAVTGWPARVVEYFQFLAMSQAMNHTRPEALATASLRDAARLLRVNSAFDRQAHTLDVRRIATGAGRYNIPNVGIFLWRLQPYCITRGTARRIGPGELTFEPLGLDIPLFNPGRAEKELAHMAEPVNVPEPLPARALYADLEALRQALTDGESREAALGDRLYFGAAPVLEIYAPELIPQEKILICDLSEWSHPPDQKSYTPADQPGGPAVAMPIAVAVDPALGRLTFPAGVDPERVEVTYCYGFSADMGGGPYPRPGLPAPTVTVGPTDDLAAAIAALGDEGGVVQIDHSGTIAGDLVLTPAPGRRLTIQAQEGERPVLDGSVRVVAAANAAVTLDGLLLAGSIKIDGAEELALEVRDCTIRPWRTRDAEGTPEPPAEAAIEWSTENSLGTLRLDRVLTGRLLVDDGVQVEIDDSIVDALADDLPALAASADGLAPAGTLTARRTTFIGSVRARKTPLVENCIFTGPLVVDRRQTGCVRFSYLPEGSQAPRRFACQPDRAIQEALAEALRADPDLPPAEQAAIEATIRAWLRPAFSDREYGRPAYLQLALACPAEIRRGADDESEMGAFHNLYAPQRETNLRVRLDEYLRFNLEAGIFYAT